MPWQANSSSRCQRQQFVHRIYFAVAGADFIPVAFNNCAIKRVCSTSFLPVARNPRARTIAALNVSIAIRSTAVGGRPNRPLAPPLTRKSPDGRGWIHRRRCSNFTAPAECAFSR